MESMKIYSLIFYKILTITVNKLISKFYCTECYKILTNNNKRNQGWNHSPILLFKRLFIQLQGQPWLLPYPWQPNRCRLAEAYKLHFLYLRTGSIIQSPTLMFDLPINIDYFFNSRTRLSYLDFKLIRPLSISSISLDNI